MEGAGTLKVGRRLRHHLDESCAPRSQFGQDILDVLLLMAERQLLESSPNRRGVHLLPLPKILEPFLPEFLNV
jgi:hypothetical protein